MTVILNDWPEETYDIAAAIERWSESETGPYYKEGMAFPNWGFDSRSLPRYCLEATELFSKFHADTDWGQAMWYDAMQEFQKDMLAILDECSRWWTQHSSMHGSLTIYGMMANKFPEKYQQAVEGIS